MNPLRSSCLLLAALAISVSPAWAGDNCKPDFKVVNQKVTSIKVTAVEYRLKGTSTWFSEDVWNEVLTKNQSHTWKTQSLSKADVGDHIDVRVSFQNDTGRGYGSTVASAPTVYSNVACDKNKVYTMTVK